MIGVRDDRVPPRPALRGPPLPADRPAGPPGPPARVGPRRGPAADGEGGGGPPGHQPQHGVEGVQGAGALRPGGGPPGGGDVRDGDRARGVAGGPRTAATGPGSVADQGPAGGARRREHRGAVPGLLSGGRGSGGGVTGAVGGGPVSGGPVSGGPVGGGPTVLGTAEGPEAGTVLEA